MIDEAQINELLPMKIYPNPSSGHITVEYNIDFDSPCLFEVLDQSGRLVKQINLGILKPGNNTFDWNGIDQNGLAVATGTYICRIVAGNFSMSGTIIFQ